MTDDNKQFQPDDHDEFKFDDDMNQFFDDSIESSEEVLPEENLTKAQKFKNQFTGLGGKFSSLKLPNFKEHVLGNVKNRRIFMAIVFVILVVIIYMFIGGESSSPTAQLANGKIQAAPATAMSTAQVAQLSTTGSTTKPASFADQGLNPSQATQPIKMPAPIPAAPPVNIANEFAVKPDTGTAPVVVSGISKTQLTNALDDLNTKLQTATAQQMQAMAMKLDAQYIELSAANQKLANQMSQLQQELVDLKTDVTTSHNNIRNLQGKVSDIVNGYVGSFNANGTSTYKNVPRPQPTVVIPSTTYVVQAIVPGRAWLYGSNGQTISVGVGDKIDSYGNVMSIDSLSGTVTMSNGAVLKPGA